MSSVAASLLPYLAVKNDFLLHECMKSKCTARNLSTPQPTHPRRCVVPKQHESDHGCAGHPRARPKGIADNGPSSPATAAAVT